MDYTHAGIDVSAKTLKVALEGSEFEVENTSEGHQQLVNQARCGQTVRFCMESTGVYGLDLAVAVKNSMVDKLVRVLRLPARVAGFQSLQLFLESGLRAFRIMGDPAEFLDTICTRERMIMEAIVARKPDPFMIPR